MLATKEGSVFKTKTAPVNVLLARVIGYDKKGAVVRVRTQDERELNTQAISSLLNIGRDGDLITGAGVGSAPETGSLAIVLRTSLGEWLTLGYLAPYDGPTNKYAALKEELNPGDVSLTTRSGNSVKVLAGGLTNIRASAITGTAYVPDENLIHSTCRNYKIDTLAGNLDWKIDSNNGTGSAVMAVNASLAEDSPQAVLSLGHNSSGNLVQITTSRAPESSFAINRQGVVRVDSAKDVNVQAQKGNFRANGRMIYLNSSGKSGVQNSLKFPGNAPQLSSALPSLPSPPAINVPDFVPSLPTPPFKFPAFKAIPTSLPLPDPKRLLKLPTLKLPTSPLPRVNIPSPV